jgi:hypothetical protein
MNRHQLLKAFAGMAVVQYLVKMMYVPLSSRAFSTPLPAAF